MKQKKNNPVQQGNNSLNSVTKTFTKKIKSFSFTPKLIIFVALGTILVVLFCLGIISSLERKKAWHDTPTPIVENNTKPRITRIPNLIPTTKPTDIPLKREKLDLGEISWLQFPQPIKLNILKKPIYSQSGDEISDGSYFLGSSKMHKTGTFSDGSFLVNLYIDSIWRANLLYRFIYTPSKQVFLLREDNYKEIKQVFTDFIPIKIADINIKGLDTPKTIKLSNITLILSNDYTGYSFAQMNNPQKLSDSPYGPIYVSYNLVSKINGNSYDKRDYGPAVFRDIYLHHPDDTVTIYTPELNFFTDDKVPIFTFLNGSLNKDQYSITGLGFDKCGWGGVKLIKEKDLNLNDLSQIGTLSNNTNIHREIYQVKNPNHWIVKILYNDFNAYSSSNQGINSVEEYAKLPNHFLWQDNLGSWNIFINEKYTPQAECGKPVIYLYPQKDTQVKVQVGAQITKSEPIYPQEGWLVTAKPNGELTYQNQNYPYLFWEGLGNGLYPDYRNRGVVVAQIDLVSILYKQLSQLGLNQKESADFMEFWQPKLPQTPYVRLTWLNTKEMDTLAPLAVTPRPDTSIRIFLEFQGLDKPIKLIPQTLSAPTRKGFTLIEWGGLLLKTRE